mmetsp:Transcript_26266/g.66225  ORF Transcript_26266/g.66225 Transcript_26266/m.66225 type:complete len:267 (-) Transcript_26266:8176-8976(-)
MSGRVCVCTRAETSASMHGSYADVRFNAWHTARTCVVGRGFSTSSISGNCSKQSMNRGSSTCVSPSHEAMSNVFVVVVVVVAISLESCSSLFAGGGASFLYWFLLKKRTRYSSSYWRRSSRKKVVLLPPASSQRARAGTLSTRRSFTNLYSSSEKPSWPAGRFSVTICRPLKIRRRVCSDSARPDCTIPPPCSTDHARSSVYLLWLASTMNPHVVPCTTSGARSTMSGCCTRPTVTSKGTREKAVSSVEREENVTAAAKYQTAFGW